MSVNQVVGGHFQDSQGNILANGYLTFTLNQDETDTATENIEICSGRVIRIPLDDTGSIPASPVYSLWPNDLLTPTGSFYSIIAYSKHGERVWGPNFFQILSTPSPYSIDVWEPTTI